MSMGEGFQYVGSFMILGVLLGCGAAYVVIYAAL